MDDKTFLSRTVGQTVKAWREHRNLRPTDLAEKSGVGKGYLSLLEADRVRCPGDQQLVKIAQALGIRTQSLVARQLPHEQASLSFGERLAEIVAGHHITEPEDLTIITNRVFSAASAIDNDRSAKLRLAQVRKHLTSTESNEDPLSPDKELGNLSERRQQPATGNPDG